MNHTRTAAIVGGDVRQVFLGELLAADGMRVGTVGLERHVCELPIFCDMAARFRKRCMNRHGAGKFDCMII